MLIYFWVVLVISATGFLEDLLGCSAIRIISDSYHIVNISKCMCSQHKVIHSFKVCSLITFLTNPIARMTMKVLVKGGGEALEQP